MKRGKALHLYIINIFYNAMAVPVLHIAFFLATLVSRKARLRRSGLNEIWKTLTHLPQTQAGERRIWFHAASMGEFEQVKPIIERIKAHPPQTQIIVSFFSPSGYQHQRGYALADAVVYMPLDGKQATKCFLDHVQPDAVVIARYDVWWNMLTILQSRSVPTFLVCATLNEKSVLLRIALGRAYLRALYGLLTHIFTAGVGETAKFQVLGITTPLTTAADTRFDRIAAQVASQSTIRSETAERLGLGASFFADDDTVLVLGSSWKSDEDCVLEAMQRLEQPLKERLRLVIVPHEPTEVAVKRLRAVIPDSEVLSKFQGNSVEEDVRHIIVDSVGKLLRLYALADVAFIGGGFGAGVHSITEPAGYGLPLACGGNIGRARDAKALYEEGALSLIHNPEEMYAWLYGMLTSPETRKKQGTIAHRYIHAGLGWSEKIAEHIIEKIESNR